LLAVFPASFDTAAAAAVWNVGAEDASADLGELRRRSMLLWDAADERWRLHDLMRDIAGIPLEGQDAAALAAGLETARARHARHYCDVLGAANGLYLKGGPGVMAGLALYDLEQRNIAAGQAWAAARIDADDAAVRLASDYANAGFKVLPLRLHPRERIDWLEAQRRACVHLDDRASEGCALGNLGSAWTTLGEPRVAIGFHEQALKVSREIGDRRAEGHDLGSLGNAWRALGEPGRAAEFYVQSLAIAHEVGDRLNEGGTLVNLGLAWADVGEPRRAIELYDQALAIAREIGDRMGEGNALFNFGVALDALGERDEAVRRVREALAIFEAIGAKDRVETVHAKLAEWGAADGRS
jgi:tetratricopeptide (TPR) repeat protein